MVRDAITNYDSMEELRHTRKKSEIEMTDESNKRVIVVGAGIAGLSAACYLQMNDYDTQIFEMHNKPGGLCTAWKRKGYTIDGGIHGLLGSSSAGPFYKLWNEIVEMDKIEFVNYDVQAVFEFEDTRRFYLYVDLDKLEKYMKEISPEDSKVIEEFVNGVRRLQGVQMPVACARSALKIITSKKLLISLLCIFSKV